MNTKDIKKMAILDQALMQKAENGKVYYQRRLQS